MKKIFILIIVLIFNLVNLNKYTLVNAEDELFLNGNKALVMEVSTGRVIFATNEHIKAFPASMTKMMGMYLVLEAEKNHEISFDDEAICSSVASGMGGTQIYLEQGEKMSINDLFKAVAINSANDAIVCLGEHIFGSNELFIEAMNKKAKQLGMNNTNFINATGFDDENHYTTVYDMALIGRRLVLDFPKVLEYSSLQEDYIKGNRSEEFWLVNTNKLLKHCEGMDGLKTGYTSKAGYNLTSTVKRNGIRVLSVVMNEKSIQERSQDTIRLVNYAFSKLKVERLFDKDEIITKYTFPNALNNEVEIYLKENCDVVLFKNEKIEDLKTILKITNTHLPLKENDIVGYLEIELPSKDIIRVDVIVKINVEKKSLIKIWINNIIKWII